MAPTLFTLDSYEVQYLIQQDPLLGKLIQSIEKVSLGSGTGTWEQLIEMIIAQQLSSKVATVLWQRFLVKFPLPMSPESIIDTPDDVLRNLGLSFQKIRYIRSIATTVKNDDEFMRRLIQLDNEQAIAQLTTIKGIGRWTAEMFLIFGLHRLDVMSYGDLGLRTAVSRLYNKKKEVSEITFKRLTKRWHPYQSIASLYLWVGYEQKLL